MKQARILMVAAACAAVFACTSTTRRATEYRNRYHLAEDVNLYHCSAFTGLKSLWFTGPQNVETICSARIPVEGATSLRSGCPVRVLKLFKVNTLDASYSDAKLEVIDTDSMTTHIVYVKWPGAKSLLTAEAEDGSK